MIKINYSNYLIDENFDFESEYQKIFVSNFQINEKSKPKQEFKYSNGKEIFKNKKQVSLGEIFSKFKDKKIEEFDTIFTDKSLHDVFKLHPDNLITVIKNNGDKSNLKKIKFFFNYNKFQSEITKFFTDNFSFRTCFYCNKDFITNFNASKEVSTFQLDHFYDKATYPYLSLSFYNLIPSCATCNSKKIKGSENCYGTCISPNNKAFNFNEKVKFKLFLSDKTNNLQIQSKDDIEIPLKENYSNKYTKYIEVFKLNERYKSHKDIVYDMITKAELYPESRLKELQNLTGIPYQQIKKDIFNLINEDEDLSKKPFSKLIKDISEELKLL